MCSNLRSWDIGFSWYYGENIHKSCIDYIITHKQTRHTKPPSLLKKNYQYFIERYLKHLILSNATKRWMLCQVLNFYNSIFGVMKFTRFENNTLCFQNMFSKDLKYVNDIADDNRLIIIILFKYIKPEEQFANILYM